MEEKTKKHKFMLNLKNFIEVMDKLNCEKHPYQVYSRCPATKSKDFNMIPAGAKVDATLYSHCREVMKSENRCPCTKYGPYKAVELARKKVKLYFNL